MERIYQSNLVQKILTWRRKKRVKFFLSQVQLEEGMRIIDVGCGPNGRSFSDFLPHSFSLIGIDILEEKTVSHRHPNFRYQKLGAADLKIFQDREFDLLVSIGMLEHICDKKELTKICSEIERISKQFVLVVPWKYAIIEPHFKFPFFQLLNRRVQTELICMLNLHGLRNQAKKGTGFIDERWQWLSNREWSEFFPAAKVVVNPGFDTISIIKRSFRRPSGHERSDNR